MWQKMHIIRMYSENFIRCGNFTVMNLQVVIFSCLKN